MPDEGRKQDEVEKVLSDENSLVDRKKALIDGLLKEREAAIKSFDCSTITGALGAAGGEAKGLTLITLVCLARCASVTSQDRLTHGINELIALRRPPFTAAFVKRRKERVAQRLAQLELHALAALAKNCKRYFCRRLANSRRREF